MATKPAGIGGAAHVRERQDLPPRVINDDEVYLACIPSSPRGEGCSAGHCADEALAYTGNIPVSWTICRGGESTPARE